MKYRYKALQSRRNPDQLDSPMVLAQPHGWVAVFVVLIVTTMLVLWAFLARIPQTVEGKGVLGYPGTSLDVQAPAPGTVVDVKAKQGDVVQQDQDLATMRTATGQIVAVKATSAGRITAVGAKPGSYVPPGQSVVTIEPGYGSGMPMQVVAALPIEQAAGVRAGQQVLITVPGVNSRRHGQLRGVVRYVSDFAQKQGDHSTRSLVVELQRRGTDYVWTSGHSPPDPLMAETPVQLSVETARRSPVEVLFGGG